MASQKSFKDLTHAKKLTLVSAHDSMTNASSRLSLLGKYVTPTANVNNGLG